MDRVSSIFARLESRRPPNTLTSDVIGHVLPRAPVSRGGVFSASGPDARGAHTETLPQQASLPTNPEPQATPFAAPQAAKPEPVAEQSPLDCLIEASAARKMKDVSATVSVSSSHAQAYTPSAPMPPTTGEVPARPLPVSSEPRPLPLRAGRTLPSVRRMQAAIPGAAKPNRKRVRIKTDRRREQCRANQARYRKKQSNCVKELETSVQQLRLELQILEVQHTRLVSSARSTLLHVVVEYFHLFRNGTRLPDQMGDGPEAWLQKSEAEQQLAFVHSSVSSDVLLGEQRGIDALMQQWRRYTSYFDDLQFHLEHMTQVSDDFIAATASLHVTISESTLQHVFPHLLSGDQGQHYTLQEDKKAVLRGKLLGQRLSLPCRLCFEWNKANKQVVRMERTVDFLPSLIQILETIEDAAFGLEHVLIDLEGNIGQLQQ